MVHATPTIRPFAVSDRAWATGILEESWGSTLVVSRGRLHDAVSLPGFVAVLDGLPAGLVTYHLEGNECELVTINSQRPGAGIGSSLLQAVKERAKGAGCRRLWLITTNDNLVALKFYQQKGFELVAVHRNALEVSRQLKPQIPEIGRHDIPLRDEVELEYVLEAGPSDRC